MNKRKHLRDSPAYRQQCAALLYGYGAIRLRRDGDYAIVEVEHKNKWVPVIKEFLLLQFCHIIEPVGIEAVITGKEPV